MAITRLLTSSFADDCVTSDKIAEGVVGVDKIAFSPGDTFVIPTGNTAERPVSPTTGATRFNSDLSQFEVFDGLTWSQL